MNPFVKALLTASLALGASQGMASVCSPTDPTSDCSLPPPGAILDLAGTAVPTAYQLYSVSFVASTASTTLTFAFRSDPGYIRLDDVTLTAVNGPNLIVNGDFEGGTYLDVNSNPQPAGWLYYNPNNGSPSGIVTNSDTPHGGVANYVDGVVGAYDFLTQAVPTEVGTQYTLSFYAFNPAGGTFSQTSTGGEGGEGGEGSSVLDLLVYADAQPAIAAVPEPGSVTLLGLGVAGLVLARRRKQK